MQVLIVDDSRTYAETPRDILTRGGYEVGVAGSGAEALEIVHRMPPALVIMDVYMADGDGDATCRRLKSDPRAAAIPIVISS